MPSSYLTRRWVAIIQNDELYLARVQEPHPITGRWETLYWVKCRKTLPVDHPERWTRFLER